MGSSSDVCASLIVVTLLLMVTLSVVRFDDVGEALCVEQNQEACNPITGLNRGVVHQLSRQASALVGVQGRRHGVG